MVLFDKLKFNKKVKVLDEKFPFYDNPNTAVITCSHIINKENPILYVSHDSDDGMWQFLCGQEHEIEDSKIISLKEMYEIDNSIRILKDMACGYYAQRKNKDDEWIIKKHNN